MPKLHRIQQGECILSISTQYRLTWEKIWEHPRNAQLKQQRKKPNVLLPGDVVFIPDADAKDESRQTSATHKFQTPKPLAIFRLQVFDGEEPRANQDYALDVDGSILRGTTDSDGMLEQPIALNAKKAKLTIGPDMSEYTFDLGHLDPIEESSGIWGRLSNLGYDCGRPDGSDKEKARKALMLFQRRFGLEGTGEPDAATRSKLEELHDTVCSFPKDDESQSSGGAN